MTTPREMLRDIADVCAALDAVLAALPDITETKAAERRERQERERAERIAQNRALLAAWDSMELEGFALDCYKLHSPINGGDELSCSHCEGVDEDGDLEWIDWPCATAGLLIQHYGKDGR